MPTNEQQRVPLSTQCLLPILADDQLRKASLKSHIFDESDCSFSVLDQRLLPSKVEFVRIRSVQDGYEAIKQMKKCQLLLSARPTAINLANAFHELIAFLKKQSDDDDDGDDGTVNGLKIRLKQFVLDWQSCESAENAALLANSVEAVLSACASAKRGVGQNDDSKKLVVMTICNTGQLATSSLGTALGVILLLHRLNRLQLAIALETRPYNQGSRLTAFELQQSGVPFRLIADSAAASAMRHFGVDVVLVGADQVARNGDTANKIGTYALAVLAHHHRMPFFVVTPMASVNGRIRSGGEIPIEERPARELTQWNGVPTCPSDCPVWNPSFDVTPAELVTKILTEKGNFYPSELAEYFS